MGAIRESAAQFESVAERNIKMIWEMEAKALKADHRWSAGAIPLQSRQANRGLLSSMRSGLSDGSP